MRNSKLMMGMYYAAALAGGMTPVQARNLVVDETIRRVPVAPPKRAKPVARQGKKERERRLRQMGVRT